MADRYIDYAEVSEYGRYCAQMVRTLVGASPLVDMELLAQRLLAAVTDVETDITRAVGHGSSFRMGRVDSGQATQRLRDRLRRFFHHLQALPRDQIDFEAFFAGAKLGGVHRLKPEDLVSRADEVLRGFAVPANAALEGAATWRDALQEARNELDASFYGKLRAWSDNVIATTDMVAARERFLDLYNGVAKPLVRGVLRDLGRVDEYRRFFRDLQVNETRRASGPDE